MSLTSAIDFSVRLYGYISRSLFFALLYTVTQCAASVTADCRGSTGESTVTATPAGQRRERDDANDSANELRLH